MSDDDALDDALIGRAKRGDRAAFGALVKKYQRRVYATAFHIMGHHGDADDVAQEAFIRIYRGLGSFDGRADFFTWVYRVVVNVALNQLRSRQRHAAASLDAASDEGATLSPPPADGSTDPRLVAEARELVAAVMRALAELPPSLRITLVLATIEDMPYKQIALALEIPEGTVAWRVNQARKLLRRKLAALAPETSEISTDDLLRRAKEAVGAP